jgi:hypothetical protein
MRLIAISGQANTGKNTLAKLLINELDEDAYMSNVHIMAFADPIKEMAQIMFPKLPSKFLYGSSKYRNEIVPNAWKDGKPLTVRELLIDIGTKLGRGYNDNIWLNNFDARLESNMSNYKYDCIICPDERFPNEFYHLKNKGFYQIRLYRKAAGIINSTTETAQNEIQDSEFDSVIHNDQTLQDLENEVEKVVANILALE